MMTTTTTWWTYIEEGLERNDLTQSQLADSINLNRGGMSQWRNNGVVPENPERIRAVAHILGTNIFDALIASGHLTAQEVETARTAAPLEDRTDEELLEELLRRVRKRNNTRTPAKKPAQSTTVTRKPTRRKKP